MHSLAKIQPQQAVQMWCARLITVMVAVLFRVANNCFVMTRQRKKFFWCLASMALLACALSFAQGELGGATMDAGTGMVDVGGGNATNPSMQSAPLPSYSGQATAVFRSIGASIDQALTSLKIRLESFKLPLIYAGVAIGVLWAGVKCLATSKGLGEWFAECVPIFVATAVVMALLSEGGVSSINSTMDVIAGALVKSSSPVDMNKASSVIPYAAKGMMTSVGKVMDMPYSQTAKSVFESLTFGLINTISVALMKLVTCVFIILAGCTYVATAVMAMVSVTLVMALAPVMVPFLIFGPLTWLFESWLKFLIGAGMLKLVGLFMLEITDKVIAQMSIVATEIQKDTKSMVFEETVADVLLYGTLIFISLFSALLMSQVPSIASGILSGGASGAGFKGLSAATNSAAGRAMGASGRGAGAAAGAGARLAYDKYGGGEKRAAARGARDAAQGFSSGGKHEGSVRSANAYQRGNAAQKAADGRRDAFERSPDFVGPKSPPRF